MMLAVANGPVTFGAWLRAGLLMLGTIGFIGWFLWRALRRSVDPPALLFKLVLTAGLLVGGFMAVNPLMSGDDALTKIAGLLVSMVFALAFAIIWVPVIVDRVSEAFGGLYTGGTETAPPQPAYSVAETRIKQGRYREAMYEVQRQLEQFPTDVTGHMKLAELQVQHLDDLVGATLTIERLCHQPGHLPQHLANALNSLADWHLKAHDPDSARTALERIAALFPNTDQAQSAAQRLAHLATPEALLAAHEHRAIKLRPGLKDLGLHPETQAQVRSGDNPEATAERLISHLHDHPLDNEAREKLALLYSDHYWRPDLAIAQLEELCAVPNQPGKDVARWLSLIADFQVQSGADYDAVRATLQRVIDLFPGLAPAEMAQQRIEHIRLELKGRQQATVIPLGTYEKDLGLRRDRPK